MRAPRDKEQLAEGLHLIDFEQLKIENQSLNEKIEEHNDELIKLRRKMTVTVQVRCWACGACRCCMYMRCGMLPPRMR